MQRGKRNAVLWNREMITGSPFLAVSSCSFPGPSSTECLIIDISFVNSQLWWWVHFKHVVVLLKSSDCSVKNWISGWRAPERTATVRVLNVKSGTGGEPPLNGQWAAYLICQETFGSLTLHVFDVFLLVCAPYEIRRAEKFVMTHVGLVRKLRNFHVRVCHANNPVG